jgi:hypothetical protein
MKPFFGKYRGKVVNPLDPLLMGRVQVSVPAVLGDAENSWAMPCTPYGGSGVGLFAVPPNGANVWVEFEGGDPDYPILGGCFWGPGEAPAAPAIPQMTVLKTGAITLQLSDVPGAGGLSIQVGPPAVPVPLSMTFDATGIKLSMAAFSVALSASGVSINDGALEVI